MMSSDGRKDTALIPLEPCRAPLEFEDRTYVPREKEVAQQKAPGMTVVNFPNRSLVQSDELKTDCADATLEAHYALQDYCSKMQGLINLLHSQVEQLVEIQERNTDTPA